MQQDNQFVAAYIFHIKAGKRLSALANMATMPRLLSGVKGCSFAKMMGSGHGEGFSIKPNFGVYAALMVFDNMDSIYQFESESKVLADYLQICDKYTVIHAQPYVSHGSWDGVQPITRLSEQASEGRKLVLTRAKIKWHKLWQFWQHVPLTSTAISEAKGRILSIGVGELPWIQQATFSIWDSEQSMKSYAYNNKAHLEAIKKTQNLKWYSEELFARFNVLDIREVNVSA